MWKSSFLSCSQPRATTAAKFGFRLLLKKKAKLKQQVRMPASPSSKGLVSQNPEGVVELDGRVGPAGDLRHLLAGEVAQEALDQRLQKPEENEEDGVLGLGLVEALDRRQSLPSFPSSTGSPSTPGTRTSPCRIPKGRTAAWRCPWP